MAARTVDDVAFAESTGESTTTGDTDWHDKVELNGSSPLPYSPGASETWYEIASAAYSCSAVTDDVLARYWDGTTAICNLNEEMRTTSDYRSALALHKVVYGGSPGAQSRKWQFANENSALTAAIRHACITALKHTTNDQYAETLAETTITEPSGTGQTIVSIGFDPGATRTYTFLACGEYNINSTGQSGTFRVFDGVSSYHGAYEQRITDTSNWASWSHIATVTLTSGTKTVSVEYIRGGGGTHKVRNVKLLLLCDDGFVSVNRDHDDGRTTSTGTTDWVTKSSVTFTPTAIEHLLMGVIHVDRSGSIPSGRLLDDATERHLGKPDVVNSTIRDNTIGAHIRSLTAASTTFAQQAKLDASGSTLGMQGSYIGVYELDSAASGTNAPAEAASLTVAASNGSVAIAPTAGAASVTVAAQTPQASVAPTFFGFGEPILDELGNPILDENGDPILDMSTGTGVDVAASDATTKVQPTPAAASVAVTASNPSTAVATPAGAGSVTVGASDATVTVGTAAAAEAASLTVGASDGTVQVAPTAGVASVAVAASDAAANYSSAPSAEAASVTVGASSGTVKVSPIAGAASVSVAAQQPAVAVATPAGTGSVTVAGQDPAPAVAPTAGTGSVAVGAENATVSTTGATNAPAGAAAATAAASDAQAKIEPQAGAGSVTVGAADPAPLVAPTAGVGSVAVGASDATVSTSGATNAAAGAASMSVGAEDAQAKIEPHAGAAAATVAAVSAQAAVAPQAGTAPVVVGASDATVSTSGNTNAAAGAAAVTVGAVDAGVAISPNAGAAAVTVTASGPAVTVAVLAGAGSVTIEAEDATALVQVPGVAHAQAASLTVGASSGTVKIAPTAGVASVAVEAHSPRPRAVGHRGVPIPAGNWRDAVPPAGAGSGRGVAIPTGATRGT